MKTRHIFPLAALLAVVALFASSCSRKVDLPYYTCPMHQSVKSHDPHGQCPICGMPLVEVDHYTCTMHPSVNSHDPEDKCPICSMNLVPVLKKPTGTNAMGTNGPAEPEHAPMGGGNSADMNMPAEFVVPTNRQQQIGVTYAAVSKGPLRRTIRAVGTVTYDKLRRWDFVARVDGYIQKLEVSSRGETVVKDQPLLTIYSPDLLTTQREFVDLLQMRDRTGTNDGTETLIESAKRRLGLWNVTPEQIAELERSRTAKETLTLYSPFAGVVQDLRAGQGQRVAAGDELVDVVDLSTVWVWVEFYQDDLTLLKKGLPVTITTASLPGQKFTGDIALVDPFINEVTRTGRARVNVENAGFKLQPGMFVDVELEVDGGEGLTVPVCAVMPTGRHNLVFVDKGNGMLEPRFVELGGKFGDVFAVSGGLREGERVVNSANFLIDAEAKVQGALKTWGGGNNP